MQDGATSNPKIKSGSTSSNGGSREMANSRIERGECPDCGLKTHRIGRFKKPKPLTVPGYVMNGLCLLCNPIVESSKMKYRHRIEKILTDGEGSLVSALTFGPAEQSFDESANNFPTASSKRSTSQQNKTHPSLMHTEIWESLDEDNEEDINHAYHPSRPLTIEEAMERGKIFAEEEELSLRFSEEDMQMIKPNRNYIHILHATVEEPADEDRITQKDEKLPPANAAKKKRSMISRFSFSKNSAGKPDAKEDIDNTKFDATIEDEHDENLATTSQHDRENRIRRIRHLPPDAAFKERMLQAPQLSRWRSSSPPKLQHSSQSSPTWEEMSNPKRSQSEGIKGINSQFQNYLASKAQGMHTPSDGALISSVPPPFSRWHSSSPLSKHPSENIPNLDNLTLSYKRSQSEGNRNIKNQLQNYLNSNKQGYKGEYPDIPPPPFPSWEKDRTTMVPSLSRFMSEATNISMRATNGLQSFPDHDKMKELPSLDHIQLDGDPEDFSDIDEFEHPYETNRIDASRQEKKSDMKLKHYHTTPVGKEAVSTGVKKMVSFHRSKTGSMESDWGTSSSVSWGSETFSKSSQHKYHLKPILRNKSVGSDMSMGSARKMQNQRKVREHKFDDDSSGDYDVPSISEKVRQMKDEDDSFIARKMSELSEFEKPELNDIQPESIEEEKVLKTRLTQLGSSTSRDLDHAFVAHQLRKLNSKDHDPEDKGWAPQPPSILNPLPPRETSRTKISSFIQNNTLTNLQASSNAHTKFDPNRASLVSDDDDDAELLMNHTRLGLNNVNSPHSPGIENSNLHRPSLMDINKISHSSPQPDSFTQSRDTFNSPRPPNRARNDKIDADPANPSHEERPAPQDSMPFGDAKKPPRYDSIQQEFNGKPDASEMHPYDGKKISRETSSSMIVRKLIESNSTSNNIPLLVRLLSNRVSTLNRESLLLALNSIQFNAVQMEGKNQVFENKGIDVIVETMWSYLEDPNIQMAACGALWAISTNCEDHQKQILAESGAAEAILCGMQSHLHHAELLVQVCGVLGIFCLDESKFNLMSMGVIMFITSMMKRHPRHMSVQIWSIRALWSLCKDDSSGEKIIELEKAGCIDLICNAMSIENERETWEWGCRLLWCLSRNYVVVNKILEKENTTLKIVLGGLDKGALDKELIFGLLLNLTVVMGKDATEIGGITLPKLISSVIFIMQEHQNNVRIQVQGCGILSSFASKNKENRSIVTAYGGIQVVYDAMKSFPSDEIIEEQGCSVLFSCSECIEGKPAITCDIVLHIVGRLATLQTTQKIRVMGIMCGVIASLAVETDLHHLISSSGVIAIVLDMMYRHSREADIQDVACTLIRNLSYKSSMLDKLATAGAISSLLNVMKTHPDVASIQESACISLWNFSTGSTKHATTILDNGGIQAIISVMQSHDQSERIQEISCGALWCFASGNQVDREFKSPKSIIGKNGADAIVCAMFTYPNSTPLLENACGALSVLSTDSSMLENLASNGTIDALIESMRGNISSIRILELGCITLRNIIIAQTLDAQITVAVTHVVLRSMREHPHKENVQRQACCTLWSLTSSSEAAKAKSEIISGGGIDLIMAVLEHFEWNRDVHIEAREALETLIT